MIGKHCGEYLVHLDENAIYFRRRCVVCKRIFKQRKRRTNDCRVELRMSTSLKTELENAATEAGKTVSDFIRDACNALVKK